MLPRLQTRRAGGERDREMEADPFLKDFDSSDLKFAEEFLTTWLPFLTKGLCDDCADVLLGRIRSLNPGREPDPDDPGAKLGSCGLEELDLRASAEGCEHMESIVCDADTSSKERVSWADMAQQDEMEEGLAMRKDLEDGEVDVKREVKPKKVEISREDRERLRYLCVERKKDFVCFERVNGKIVNILEGLELHTGVFSSPEQKKIVDFVYELQGKGRNNELGELTYSAPKKWMRGKGRVTIQFGCCYNYAEKNGVPPGILHDAMADPLPYLFKVMIRRLVSWHVLPTYCVPDSCIVNIYEPGDCIPPHIDNHDFVRPFCTVSFLSECNILFGSNLKVAGPGEFIGSCAVPLPVGSVLVLNGYGADVAKHCVPAVPSKRISITFRKMDKLKWPRGFKLEPDLQHIRPYDLGAGTQIQKESMEKEPFVNIRIVTRGMRSNGRTNEAKSRSRRNDEAEEPVERYSHHGSMNDEDSYSYDNKASSRRQYQMGQRRLTVTRDFSREDGSSAARSAFLDSTHP